MTVKNGSLLRELRTQVCITPAFDPSSKDPEHPSILRRKYIGLWDTGATHTAVTRRVVEDLNLPPIGKVLAGHAQGESLVSTYAINCELPNDIGFPLLTVTESVLGGDIDVLIGMDIIGKGDFLLTNHNGATVFTFQTPSLGHCAHADAPTVTANKPPFLNLPAASPRPLGGAARNARCPCKSGKKYKQCCGKLG